MQRRPTKRYHRAYAALYGELIELGNGFSCKAKVSESRATEAQEQIVAATWMAKNNILFFHVPNGGYRDISEAAKFKRMGVRSGVPDICIPIARKGYHGLYIELKRESGGSLSETQRWWLAELEKQGYACYVAKGANDLIQYVKNYLGDNL